MQSCGTCDLLPVRQCACCGRQFCKHTTEGPDAVAAAHPQLQRLLCVHNVQPASSSKPKAAPLRTCALTLASDGGAQVTKQVPGV